jgi:hypothetical protein
MSANNSFITTLIKTFDRDNSGSISYFELYPLFLLVAFMTIYFIVLSDLTILLILKKSRLFLLFFGLLIVYSILYIIDYRNLFKNHKHTETDTFYYYLNILNLIVSILFLNYLLLFFI